MNEKPVKPNPLSWEPMGAFACFAGSIVSLALGFAFTTNWLLDAVHHPVLHAVGIVLLIIGIPILILGGHCLDLMEKKVKKSRPQLDAHGKYGTKPLQIRVEETEDSLGVVKVRQDWLADAKPSPADFRPDVYR